LLLILRPIPPWRFTSFPTRRSSDLAMAPKENEVEIIRYLDARKRLEPFLTGADLILYGLKPGKDFANILFELEIAAFNGEIQSKEAAYEWLENRLDK